jgi:hypothetical protein
VVEKIYLFFLAGETESVFEITNWAFGALFISVLERMTGHKNYLESEGNFIVI